MHNNTAAVLCYLGDLAIDVVVNKVSCSAFIVHAPVPPPQPRALSPPTWDDASVREASAAAIQDFAADGGGRRDSRASRSAGGVGGGTSKSVVRPVWLAFAGGKLFLREKVRRPCRESNSTGDFVALVALCFFFFSQECSTSSGGDGTKSWLFVALFPIGIPAISYVPIRRPLGCGARRVKAHQSERLAPTTCFPLPLPMCLWLATC